MLWNEILEKSPTIRQLFEEKITQEVQKKQVEIDELKQENTALQIAVAELAVAQAEEITALQLAIAELSTTLSGGEV